MTEAGSRVLVVEDEERIAAILLDYLRSAGYETDWVSDGSKVEDAVASQPPDLILLDLMLPGKGGMEICRDIRKSSEVPIIMVTARAEEIDRLLGLELGADDYICKPFSPREVVARVKAVLKRTRQSAPVSAPASGNPFDIDEKAMRIAVNGQRLDLTPTEYRLLKMLSSQPGRVFSRTQLLDQCYFEGQEVFDRAIDSHVKNLRKKVAGALPDRDVIHSVYGVGYRFEL